MKEHRSLRQTVSKRSYPGIAVIVTSRTCLKVRLYFSQEINLLAWIFTNSFRLNIKNR
jgi:hypothetical protein